MITKILDTLQSPKNKDLLLTAGGMVALLAGRKVAAVSMFGRGMWGLEQTWRAKNPDFQGSMAERWERSEIFYEETHQDEVNRWLHIVGIPIIVGGTLGLLAFRPYRLPWIVSASAFGFGWALNFVGHGVFEKAAPAFADDPLSFIAGPVWDLKQVQARMGFGSDAPTVIVDEAPVAVAAAE